MLMNEIEAHVASVHGTKLSELLLWSGFRIMQTTFSFVLKLR